MIFCLSRFYPGSARRHGRRADSPQSSTNVKQTFLDLDDEKMVTENHVLGPNVKQTFLLLGEDKPLSEKDSLRIDVHPALRSSNGCSKEKQGATRNESVDSTSSVTPLIRRSDRPPASPPQTYSPRIYSPGTPPPVPGTSTEERVSPRYDELLPKPLRPSRPSLEQPLEHGNSPFQSSATLPGRSQLPMSFLVELDAKRDDQTAACSRTVSPLQNPPTPTPDRLLSESRLSSRTVSPISALSTTPVITYPSATPVYLPRPFSKYNPYRPALEPASSKNWPLEHMTIPEHSAVVTGLGVFNPARKHLTQLPPQWECTASAAQPITKPAAETEKSTSLTLPELDPIFLEDLRRRRRQQQRARDEQQKQKQKRKLERENAQKQQTAVPQPAQKPSGSKDNLKGAPPDENPDPAAPKDAPPAGSQSVANTPGGDKVDRKRAAKWLSKKPPRSGLPPRLPSKSRTPSQSPDAYEKARRISGLHELVGSSSLWNRG